MAAFVKCVGSTWRIPTEPCTLRERGQRLPSKTLEIGASRQGATSRHRLKEGERFCQVTLICAQSLSEEGRPGALSYQGARMRLYTSFDGSF